MQFICQPSPAFRTSLSLAQSDPQTNWSRLFLTERCSIPSNKNEKEREGRRERVIGEQRSCARPQIIRSSGLRLARDPSSTRLSRTLAISRTCSLRIAMCVVCECVCVSADDMCSGTNTSSRIYIFHSSTNPAEEPAGYFAIPPNGTRKSHTKLHFIVPTDGCT